MEISIETEVAAPVNDVWNAWVTPEDITRWNHAADDWCCPSAEINVAEGGKFSRRMEAKDGSTGFDFAGQFARIEPVKANYFRLEDSRNVKMEFIESESGTKVVETFDVEDENSAEPQRQGWLGILNHFKTYVESKSAIKAFEQ